MMLSLLASIVRKIIGWVVGILPVSPFANAFGSVPASLDLGLAWLNTFVPIGQILAVAALWLAGCLAYVMMRLIKKFTIDKVVGVLDA